MTSSRCRLHLEKLRAWVIRERQIVPGPQFDQKSSKSICTSSLVRRNHFWNLNNEVTKNENYFLSRIISILMQRKPFIQLTTRPRRLETTK
jgi:hypothetical protein